MLSGAGAAIELRELTKRFGDVAANDGINLHVAPGTIHGLIGENGAGKSTAMKMLYGMFAPDSGEIIVGGVSRRWRSPSDAIAGGIGMVHQHFMLAGPYSALDNILLGAEPTRGGIIDRGAARRRLEELAEQYGLPVNWNQPVEQLPVGVQQRIEIIKLLYRHASILILDEPTAVLTPQETGRLFDNLRKLRAEGKTLLLVTHKLKEVMAITDRVTVFRGGKVTGEFVTAATKPEELAEAMVGRKVKLSVDVAPARADGRVVLETRELTLAGPKTSRHRLDNVSLAVRSGEIVGIAGVEGNGQSELIEALLHPADASCRTSGVVRILGENVTSWTARSIRELGVGVIPEDRIVEGILPERPVNENFLLGLQRSASFRKSIFLNDAAIRRAAHDSMEAYDVRPRDIRLAAGKLSGGNQQKLIIAREFERNPQLLIAAQPTRGVDVGAIEFIHSRIVRARDGGAGVLLISSELDEVLSLSDRILVMYEGRIVAEYARGRATERELGLKMGGA